MGKVKNPPKTIEVIVNLETNELVTDPKYVGNRINKLLLREGASSMCIGIPGLEHVEWYTKVGDFVTNRMNYGPEFGLPNLSPNVRVMKYRLG